MSHESSEGWIDRRVRAAMRSETDALHTAIAEMQAIVADLRAQNADLHATIQAIGGEMDKRAAQIDAGLIALREAIDRDERVEALRLRVEGLSAQQRWDADQLRQALTVMAERLPLTD
jgi:Tfp pilus assembly protein FimV